MKIIVTENLKVGIRNAVARIEDTDAMLWNPGVKPAFDAFTEMQPEVIIATVKEFNDNKAFRKAVAQFKPKVKLFGDAPRGLRDQELFGSEVQVYPELFGVDDAIFSPGPEVPEYKCDISFINLTKDGVDDHLIIQLCEKIGKYNIRIYGAPVSELPQWCGHLRDHEKTLVIRSSKFNITTPHNDPELKYQIRGCGKVPIGLDGNQWAASILEYAARDAEDRQIDPTSYNTYLEIMKDILNEEISCSI